MNVSKSSIYITLHLCTFFWIVYCDKANIPHDEPSTEELKNIYSFFYISKNEDFSAEKQAKKSIQSSLSIVSTKIEPLGCKEVETNIQEAMFYKRLISILLSNLAIQRHEDILIGTLHIKASSTQFEYLQNFVKGQGSIREVDRILDNIIQQPNFSSEQFMKATYYEATYYFTLLKDNLIYYLQFVKEHWDITIISSVVIASFMILRRQKWSRGLIVFLLFDVIFIISFFITWWQLIQEAEIKLMAAQAQFVEMPIACQPHKMSLWDKMISSLYSTKNECEKYYETMMTNPKLQVTPALVLTHFLSTIIFHPLSSFGTVLSEFIKNATSELNFFYKFPVVILLFLSVCICIVLLPFTLLGGSLNFGIGPFFKFKIRGKSKEQDRIEIYEETLPKKQLKDSEKIKQDTFEEDKDPAGGDAGTDIHLRKKCKQKICKCDSEDIDLNMECKREVKIDDCQ